MQQKVFLFVMLLTLWMSTAIPAPLPAHAAPPAGLTTADWAQIQSQLAPQAITAYTQQAKLTAPDPANNDQLGVSVAVSGNTAVVGVPLDDDGGINSGSAYVFVRNGGSWSQQAKLIANDAATEDRFGLAVAISGDTAVVGAWGDDDSGSNSGSAYVFVRSGVTWSQQAKLTASDPAPEDWFGTSVAISGDTAVVGALLDDDGASSSGSAYIFVRK